MYNGVYTIEQYAYLYDTLVKWVRAKVNGESIGERLKGHGINKVVLYGINDFGLIVYDDIKDFVDVVAFIDKKADGSDSIAGKKMYGLEIVKELPKDCVFLITPEYYFKEILEDLSELGISTDRMISVSMVVE